jgi:predicted 3-demethylubiquinone-9 3-methyltransferase (glyoxalase superfamily)
MPPIIPCLWFDADAEAAAEFYASVFPEGRMLGTSRYTDAGPGPAGSVMTATFEIGGLRFLGLNGGPQFTFTEAISFQIICATQDEVDHYWARLSEGGQENVCGWLKDRFGVSWQVVPEVLQRLLTGEDRARAERVIRVMFGMKKLDIAALEAA